jgi:hypothetical protein
VSFRINDQLTADSQRNVSSALRSNKLGSTKVKTALMATQPIPPNLDEHVPSLVAQLSQNGTATLQGSATRSYDRPRLVIEDSDSSISSAAEPLYEELEGLILDADLDVTAKARRPSKHDPRAETASKKSDKRNRPSITVKLEKIDKVSHYKVHTDDNELRSLLKEGFERSKDGGIKKKHSRFRDLVFTRQFTAFDRQNPASSTSIFHGFFSLFWSVQYNGPPKING